MTSERKLFFTLWALLLIAVALWWFRLPQNPTVAQKPPRIVLSQELRTWFDSALVTHETPSQFVVTLNVRPETSKRFAPKGHEIHVAYDYLKHHSVLQSAEILSRILPQESAVRWVLPNPERLAVEEIRFRLSR